MSKDKWTNAAGGDFADAADWSKGVVPRAGDAAILGANGNAPYTVTSSADETMASLHTAANATLDITSGTFSVSNGTGVNAGTIEIAGGVFQAGGVLDNAGAIAMTGFSFFRLGADTRLKGGGVVDLGAGGFLFGAAGGLTLTNVDNTITGAGSVGTAQGMALINEAAGVVDATGNLTLQMGGGTVTNTGLLEATTASGVLTLFNTAVNSASGGVISAHDGAKVLLAGADIIGGTLESFGSGFFQTAANSAADIIDGRASSVTNSGLVEIIDHTTLTVEGVIANSGDIFLDGAGNGTDLIVGADTTLTGGGQIVMADSSVNTIVGGTASAVLDNVDNTITGAGQLGFGFLHLVNGAQGVIDANGSSNQIVLACSGTVMNAGLIEATGTAGLSITNTTIDQSAGGVILADGAAVNLFGVDIIGGTLRARNGGSVQTSYKDQNSVIDGRASPVTVAGPLRVTFGARVTIEGAIANSGTIALSGSPSLGHSTLLIGADTTLTGGGQVSLSDVVGPSNFILGATASTTLTNVDNTISGAGNIGNGVLTLNNRAKGVIDANGSYVLTIDTGAFAITNAGLIEATGSAGMNLGAIKNTGTIKCDGSLIEVNGAVTGTGVAVINDGSLYFNQAFNENVTFTGASGVLGLGKSQTYGASITGFSGSGGTFLDLHDIGFAGAGEATFSGTKTSGVLTVSDGAHTAHITLIGDFRHVSFTASGDGVGGVAVQASSAPAPPPHLFIAAMASLGGSAGAATMMAEARVEPWRPRLSAPRCDVA